MSDEKIKGPASYFPSIEKKYGQPIAHWKALVRAAGPAKHMELVAMLKEKHGMGHGHANAIVAHTLAEDANERRLRRLRGLFTGSPPLRGIPRAYHPA